VTAYRTGGPAVNPYRTGRHWGVTIVRVGERTSDGHIVGADQLVAVVTNGDTALAERIAWLLTHACPTCMGPQRETVGMVCQTCGTDYAPEPLRGCTEETRSWDHFTPEQADSYWIRCTLSGPHDEHKDENTGLTWRAEAQP
jgi:hypothetical protein